jgi:hypothetical protein
MFTPTLNQWYKLDLFLFYAGGLITPTGVFKAYVNGVFAQSWTSPGSGLGEGTGHASTDFGASVATDAQVEMDLDDWFNADLPPNMDNSLNFLDSNFPLISSLEVILGHIIIYLFHKLIGHLLAEHWLLIRVFHQLFVQLEHRKLLALQQVLH